MNQTKSETAVLTDQEARDVLRRIRGPARPMAELMYATGLRLSEIVDLRIKDVDLASLRLYVRRAHNGRDRVVTLTQDIADDLALQMEQARVRHEADLKAGLGTLLPPEIEHALPLASTRWCWQFVFSGEKTVAHPVTGQPVRAPASSRNFLEALNAAARRVGLTRSLHSHEFRHAFAARLAEAGRPLPEIQSLMGHEDLRVTAEYARRLEAAGAEQPALAVDRAWIVHYSPESPKGMLARLRLALVGG